MSAAPSYIFRRPESGVWFFRWCPPADHKALFEGRREIRYSLHTDNRALALRIARKLVSALDRSILLRMAASENGKGKSAWHLLLNLTKHAVDGTTQSLEARTDPNANQDDERKHLEAVVSAWSGKGQLDASAATLAKVIDAYLKEGERTGWTAKTKDEVAASLLLLLEVFGKDAPVSSIDRKQAAAFMDTLKKLPSNRSKRPQYKGKTAAELAAMEIPAADLMAVHTVNKTLNRAIGLYKWAKRRGEVSENPFEGLRLRKSKRADEERKPWSDENVRKLINAVLAGEHGSGKLPSRRWLPLLGCYSGARLNELAQLEATDFSEVDGVPVFSVNDEGEGKRVKTAQSRRQVPVHPELVRLGLLEYVADVARSRASGAKGSSARLFPELPMGRDGPGQAASRWFNGTFRKKLGVSDTFHALRHTVINKLREADVSLEDTKDLVGHSRGSGETEGRYMKAASISRLHAALSKLRYS